MDGNDALFFVRRAGRRPNYQVRQWNSRKLAFPVAVRSGNVLVMRVLLMRTISGLRAIARKFEVAQAPAEGAFDLTKAKKWPAPPLHCSKDRRLCRHERMKRLSDDDLHGDRPSRVDADDNVKSFTKSQEILCQDLL
jgi:hypothetical protein